MKTALPALVHDSILSRFSALIAGGRLAHAYLFTGPAGIGKLATALAIAKLVNCEQGSPAGCACPSCVKIDKGGHPDVTVIERAEDKTVISAEQVRQIIDRLGLKPMEGRYKVVILKDADQLSQDAANIFLKTLEEPPGDALLMLLSVSPVRIMRTIFSRCHEVRFFPMANGELATRLKNEYDVPSIQADILARFSAGSPGKAIASRAEFLEDKNAYLNEFVLSPASDAVIKKFSGDKDLTRELCEILLSFYRDIMLFKGGVGDELFFNRDRLVEIRRLAPRYTPEDVERIMAEIVKTRAAVDENFNVRIALTILKEML